MRKVLIPLLALVMLCAGISALAEGEPPISLELNTSKTPAFTADDPYLAGLLSETGDSTLPVIVIPVKGERELFVNVSPDNVRTKRCELTADDGEIVRINGRIMTGRKAGETVVTVTSVQDPSVSIRCRVLVIQPVTRISITPSDKKVAVGDTVTLTAAYVPEDAAIKGVVWTSEDEKIATVDKNGVVTGVKKGEVRIKATARDGSKTRASISIQVVQKPEQIELDKTDATVDVGKTAVIKATVLPKNANNRNVVWTSSDEGVASVNAEGRVTGVALGDCEIICKDKETGTVEARATVHVQQPVKKIAFDQEQITVYAGETQQLNWTVEPADASNPKISLKSGKPEILTVNEDGTVTGIAPGEVTVSAVTTDGSNRQAKIKVRVLQHVTGVHMLRKVAYIDVKQSSNTRAILEPEKATNARMTWESADTSVATAEGNSKTPNRVKITGVREGETVVTGTTEDGGYQASIIVRIGDWEHSLKFQDAYVDGADAVLKIRNVSDLTITSIKVEVTILDTDGNPVPCNSRDDSTSYQMVYKKTLEPGATTKSTDWKTVDFKLPDSPTVSEYVIKIVEFEIDHDWVKLIRERYQPTKKCPVHI